MNTHDWLDEAEKHYEAASEGPWRVAVTGPCSIKVINVEGPDYIIASTGDEMMTHASANARFISAARTGLPKAIAALRAVSAEHAPESLDLLHPDCAEGACDHDPDDPENPSVCPVFKTTVCAGCLDLAERAWRFYGEEGVEAVEYPCPTAKAIAKALGVES